MFELLCVFTSGGLVLWSRGEIWEPINLFISQVLIQERTALTQFKTGPYIVKWVIAPKLNLIFAAIYREMFPI